MLLEEILQCPDCSGIFKNNDNTLLCCNCERIYHSYGGVYSLLPVNKKLEISKFYDDEDHQQYLAHLSDIHKNIYAEHQFTSRLEYIFKNALDKMVKPLPKGATVIDIGCGAGTSFSLCREGANIIGVDCDMDLLKIAKEKYPEAVLLHADMYSPPFQDGKFKAIFCVSTLEHIFYLEHYLISIHNMLANDGFFYVLIPTEGGFAWNIGRMLLTNWRFSRRYGFNYGNALKKEHCNKAVSIDNALRKIFIVDEARSWPFGIGGVHANAVFLYRLQKR